MIPCNKISIFNLISSRLGHSNWNNPSTYLNIIFLTTSPKSLSEALDTSLHFFTLALVLVLTSSHEVPLQCSVKNMIQPQPGATLASILLKYEKKTVMKQIRKLLF